jgi:hypothetical protein
MGVAHSTRGIKENYLCRLESLCRGNLRKKIVMMYCCRGQYNIEMDLK